MLRAPKEVGTEDKKPQNSSQQLTPSKTVAVNPEPLEAPTEAAAEADKELDNSLETPAKSDDVQETSGEAKEDGKKVSVLGLV